MHIALLKTFVLLFHTNKAIMTKRCSFIQDASEKGEKQVGNTRNETAFVPYKS